MDIHIQGIRFQLSQNRQQEILMRSASFPAAILTKKRLRYEIQNLQGNCLVVLKTFKNNKYFLNLLETLPFFSLVSHNYDCDHKARSLWLTSIHVTSISNV